MFRRIATIFGPSVPFLTAHAFLRHQIRKCSLQTCWHYGFVIVDHNFVLRRFINDFSVMTNAVLAAVRLFTIQFSTNVTGLHYINTKLFVISKSIAHLVFVVHCVSSCLVVTDQGYIFGLRVICDLLDIEIWIWLCKLEVFPIFPTFVPPFHQNT
ncbi:hypothetical protein D3C86_1583930 [compost metagenome]